MSTGKPRTKRLLSARDARVRREPGHAPGHDLAVRDGAECQRVGVSPLGGRIHDAFKDGLSAHGGAARRPAIRETQDGTGAIDPPSKKRQASGGSVKPKDIPRLRQRWDNVRVQQTAGAAHRLRGSAFLPLSNLAYFLRKAVDTTAGRIQEAAALPCTKGWPGGRHNFDVLFFALRGEHPVPELTAKRAGNGGVEHLGLDLFLHDPLPS